MVGLVLYSTQTQRVEVPPLTFVVLEVLGFVSLTRWSMEL